METCFSQAELLHSYNLSDIKAIENTIYAYNLIDGSNKSIYKNQKNSFRENLKTLYPSGFSDGTKKTKLFDSF